MALDASSSWETATTSWASCRSATLCGRSAREADTIDRLMSKMTVHRFRHMPVVERGQLIGLISIGDAVKMYVADVEFEAAAMRQYITAG
jgi:predicted transcriptional regulator